jgi:hypothetical protein
MLSIKEYHISIIWIVFLLLVTTQNFKRERKWSLPTKRANINICQCLLAILPYTHISNVTNVDINYSSSRNEEIFIRHRNEAKQSYFIIFFLRRLEFDQLRNKIKKIPFCILICLIFIVQKRICVRVLNIETYWNLIFLLLLFSSLHYSIFSTHKELH